MTRNDFLPDDATLASLGELPDDEPVVMLNLLEFADDGGAEYQRYTRIALPQIEKRGGEVLYNGVPLVDVSETGHWDRVIIISYPSRAAFLDMIADPDYQAGLHHRRAGLKRTELYAFKQGTDPEVSSLKSIDSAIDQTKDDEIFALNLVRFKSDGGRSEFEKYGAVVRPMIAERGGGPVLILDGELALISDQTWDSLYLVRHASLAILQDMVSATAWQAANADRQRGIDLTWAFPTKQAVKTK